jgi:hypothetical protein
MDENNSIKGKMPEDWSGEERRKTCLIHHDTIQEIYNKLVSWKVFVFIVLGSASLVGGTNLWVQNSVRETKTEISAAFKDMKAEVKESNAVLHRRITEGSTERIEAIEKLSATMNQVNQKLGILDWRMNIVEEQLKPRNGNLSNSGRKTP